MEAIKKFAYSMKLIRQKPNPFDLEQRHTCQLLDYWATGSDSYAGTGIAAVSLVGPLGEVFHESRSLGLSSPEVGSQDVVLGLPPGRYTLSASVQQYAGNFSGQWGAYESSFMVSAAFADWCTGDFNLDGGVDGLDVGEFFDTWQTGRTVADVNVDGGVDGMDVQAFFEAWEQGC